MTWRTMLRIAADHAKSLLPTGSSEVQAVVRLPIQCGMWGVAALLVAVAVWFVVNWDKKPPDSGEA